MVNPDIIAEEGRLLLEHYGWSLKKIHKVLKERYPELTYTNLGKIFSTHGIHRFAPRKDDDGQEKSKESFTHCAECGGKVQIVRDGNVERVCQECELATPIMSMDHRLPFDKAYKPTTSLAIDKNLGQTGPWYLTGGKAYLNLYQVIKKSPAGTRDLPIRNQKMLQICRTDPPSVCKLLQWGSKFLHAFNLDGNHTLAFDYGKALRIIGNHMVIDKIDGKRVYSCFKRLAGATLTHLLEERSHPKTREIKEKLKVKAEDKEYVLTRLSNPLQNGQSHSTR